VSRPVRARIVGAFWRSCLVGSPRGVEQDLRVARIGLEALERVGDAVQADGAGTQRGDIEVAGG
jgi:hypothetical protein